MLKLQLDFLEFRGLKVQDGRISFLGNFIVFRELGIIVAQPGKPAFGELVAHKAIERPTVDRFRAAVPLAEQRLAHPFETAVTAGAQGLPLQGQVHPPDAGLTAGGIVDAADAAQADFQAGILIQVEEVLQVRQVQQVIAAPGERRAFHRSGGRLHRQLLVEIQWIGDQPAQRKSPVVQPLFPEVVHIHPRHIQKI